MSAAFRRLLPTLNRILVRRPEASKKTASGIILESKSAPNIGEVTAVGPGEVLENGSHRTMTVQIGDTVLLPPYGGEKIELEDGDYFMYRDTEIWGVLE